MSGNLFKIGDQVKITGNYVCVPCGYVQFFKEGDVFITCEACYAGTELGPVDYQAPDTEFWQLAD